MSQHNEDRDKVINALGGAKGLIDSGLPAVIFLVVFNAKILNIFTDKAIQVLEISL